MLRSDSRPPARADQAKCPCRRHTRLEPTQLMKKQFAGTRLAHLWKTRNETGGLCSFGKRIAARQSHRTIKCRIRLRKKTKKRKIKRQKRERQKKKKGRKKKTKKGIHNTSRGCNEQQSPRTRDRLHWPGSRSFPRPSTSSRARRSVATSKGDYLQD